MPDLIRTAAVILLIAATTYLRIVDVISEGVTIAVFGGAMGYVIGSGVGWQTHVQQSH